MKDVTYKRIGLGVCALSAAVVVVLVFLAVVKLFPPAVDALINHQLQMSMQARGVEDLSLVEAQ